MIYFGSTSAAMDEALEALAAQGIHLDALRLRAFPFADSVAQFIAGTTRCSSSSRTATPRCARCWSTNCEIDPARLVAVLHYDGTPITARFIVGAITQHVQRARPCARRRRAPPR